MSSGKMIDLINGKQFKDTDGDGVPDRIDCEPRNPHKQGKIHELGSKVANKVFKGKTKTKVQSFIKRKEHESDEIKREKRLIKREVQIEKQQIRIEELRRRKKQKIKRFKENIRQGGTLNRIGKGLSNIIDEQQKLSRKPIPKRKKITKKRKTKTKRTRKRNPKRIDFMKPLF